MSAGACAGPHRDAVDEAIVVLNRIHASDPTVLPALIEHRVPCNATLADDPTVQVGPCTADGDMILTHAETAEHFHVGLLGIVNGLFGVDARHRGFISAVFDDARALVRFERTPS